jgi:hypothetical protein
MQQGKGLPLTGTAPGTARPLRIGHSTIRGAMRGSWLLWVVVVSGGVTPDRATAAAKPSAAECRAACADRNIPASCGWLSAVPQRCIRQAQRACEAISTPGPAQCPPPRDLPGCGTHHDCPHGALCVDLICQVVGCGSHNGVADCTGTNRCEGDKCVVGECSAVTANCPKGFHCQPAPAPLDGISGTCRPDDPGVAYCAVPTDCITPGNFNPTCVQGICTRRARRFGRCQAHADCARRCRRGAGAARMPRCDAAGFCLCANCVDDLQCRGMLTCRPGTAPACAANGGCVCRRGSPSTSTTTSTTTTTTTTTGTTTSVTSTTMPVPCCCQFGLDTYWHCVHASQGAGWLCNVPWPECCDAPFTLCQ